LNTWIAGNPAHWSNKNYYNAKSKKDKLFGASFAAGNKPSTDGYNWYTYIHGDFNSSIIEARSWANSGGGLYVLIGNNCAQMSCDLLVKGDYGSWYNNSYYRIMLGSIRRTSPIPNVIALAVGTLFLNFNIYNGW
jgi:hypothetical protein